MKKRLMKDGIVRLTDQGLLKFAALTRLTKLCLLCCGLGEALPRYLNGKLATEEDEEEGYFIVWAQEHLPAVWLQLLATHSKVCGEQAQERLAAHEADNPDRPIQERQQQQPSAAEVAAAAAPSAELSAHVDDSSGVAAVAAVLDGVPAAAAASEQQSAVHQPGLPARQAFRALAAAASTWWAAIGLWVRTSIVLQLGLAMVAVAVLLMLSAQEFVRQGTVEEQCRRSAALSPPAARARIMRMLAALLAAAAAAAMFAGKRGVRPVLYAACLALAVNLWAISSEDACKRFVGFYEWPAAAGLCLVKLLGR
ncbi:hypothetical protein OEZ85_005883 [Tetradesmus obliquus]|uniref:Uncharacterized protein n=1 Tax=Tetradesmus obliquus TaxID=3088 RepID=A0ABY8UK66_TETOB|nr:hypothetical protein OEZ85_005883 [Tetradesmus obliquus]